MKLILDIQDQKLPFFMELLGNFNYVKAKPLAPAYAKVPEEIQETFGKMDVKNQSDDFFHTIQQAKMAELWDNKEDEEWENA